MRASAELLKALDACRDQDGLLRPESVVAAAADPDSPLHGHFCWDDAEAAHKHRLDQARQLIRSVKVEIKSQHRLVKTVAYVRDPELSGREQGYASVLSVRPRSEVAQEVVATELARAESALTRARDLADALGVQSEIDAVLTQIVILRKNIAVTTPDAA